MPLFLILLSLIDIFSGLIILFQFPFFSKIVFYLALFMLFKSLLTFMTSICFRFDPTIFMGVIDLLAGISLLLISKNIFFNFFQFVGVLVAIKGLISLILSL